MNKIFQFFFEKKRYLNEKIKQSKLVSIVPKTPNELQEQVNENFLEAVKLGHLEKVVYYLTSRTLAFRADIHYGNDEALSIASQYGHAYIVKYLLINPLLSEHADIHAEKEKALKKAIENNHLNIVEMLLTDEDIINKSYLHVEHEAALRLAIKANNEKIINFFLYSKTLSTHPNVYINDGIIFKETIKFENWLALELLCEYANKENLQQLREKNIFKNSVKATQIVDSSLVKKSLEITD